MFTDFGFTGTALYTYVAVSYVLWGMTYTLMDIPYWAMIPNFSKDKKERERISVLPRIFASVANTLIIGGFGINRFFRGGNTGLRIFRDFCLYNFCCFDNSCYSSRILKVQ